MIKIENLPKVDNDKLVHLKRYVHFINTRPKRTLKCDGLEYNIHHIYPKSIAAKNGIEDYDGDWNLIKLTHREHFIAHLILWKCGYPGMAYAFKYMNDNKKFPKMKLNSKQYAILKEDSIRDISKSFLNRFWVNNGKEEKFIDKLSIIPDGFELGRLSGGSWINNGLEERWVYNIKDIPENFSIGRLLSTTKNTKWIHKGSIRKMIPREQEIPEGFSLGSGIEYKPHSFITNGKETKYLYDGDVIEEGWEKGALNKGGKDLMWFNNGKHNIRVRKEDAPSGYVPGRLVKGFYITNGKEAILTQDENIPEGWRRGRLKRTREQIKSSLTI